MQSFYGAVAKSPSPATNGYFSSGGSCGSSCAPRAETGNGVQKSFYHQSHWSKAKAVPPPIFASNGAPNGATNGAQRRSDAALQLDRQLRGVETVSALMSVVTPSALPHFDVGNVVLAFTAAARVVEERTLSTLRFGYPAWNSLLARVRDCVPCLEPRGLAMVAHSAAKLGHKEMALWLELTRCASAKTEALTSSDLAKLCWAVSKLDLTNEFPDFWQTMEDAVICAASNAQSVDLSMLAWAFGNAGRNEGRDGDASGCLTEALARNALRLVEELTPQCLANICWAMARLGPSASAPALGALARRAEATLGDFVEPDVVHFCWAMAKLEQVDPELFDLLAEHSVRAGFLRRLTAPMASQLLWAFAAAEVFHVPLLEALANHVVRHAHVLEPAQLANSCWCFATANFSTPSLLEAFGSRSLRGKLCSFSAAEFSAFVWGLAKLWPRDLRDDEVVPHLLQLSLGHLEELDDSGDSNDWCIGYGLVNLLSSLVTLSREKMEPQGLLEQLLDRVHQRFQRRPPPDALALPLRRCFWRAGREASWEDLQAPYETLRWACRFASGENPSLTDLPDCADAGSGETGRLWELEQLLRQLWRGRERSARSAPETLRWMEDFGAEQCRELQLNLGTRAAVFDELTSQQPSLVLELQAPGDGMLSSLRLAWRLSAHGGRVLCVQEDPMHVAAARCVAELLGLSGSVEFLLGQPEDVLPQLLESHGRNAVEVLILRGGSEEAYLSQLKHVEELGLFTSGYILADHMLRYGSPRFLQEMLARRRLELVEVVDSQGPDWMALSVAPSAAAALPAPPWPPGLAALTARVRRAWRGSPAAELEQRIVRCAREMGLSPTRRFRTETASVRPLPSQVCPTSSLRLPEAEPEPVPHGRSPRVAQEYLRSLDFKRWLTELDPSGGCLEHLPQALQRYDTVEQLQEAWEQDNEKCFEALGLTCPARQRLKQRWVQDPPTTCREVHSNLPPASATGALPPSAAAVQEEPQMPDDPANLRNRCAVHLLPCITMQCGILALPFHTSTPGWEQLPVTLAMLIKGDHQTIRHQLHKAEEHSIAGFEFISKQCRSYRWSAEILPATDEQSILIHAYWGMGLHAPHPAVYGLCIRFHDSCAESKELIQRVLELTRLEPLLLARKISSDTVIDLKHLSFSDWLASVDVSLDLQQYLPCIQESYDTVSQIVATYTVENGSHEKTLDPQLFEDFAVDVAAHRAAFRSWFVRFCGVKCDGWEDPSTPHFGEEGTAGGGF
ncbi:unnamed protein product [Cladocopium goreaui]|uniref:Catechol O-methyltransferase n=1 Tax=Cladocopium goreaui TaxID=2562237 RepID=A0A9P1BR25_9DINO|nr:unnamed protein product [Cladocopium goreaui]